MTEGEICRSYRNAENQKRQIGILSDLTGKTKEEIKNILLENGEELPKEATKRPKAIKPTPKEEKAENEPICEPVEAIKEEIKRKVLPEAVAVALFTRIDQIEEEIKAKEKEYKEIVAFIQNYGAAV